MDVAYSSVELDLCGVNKAESRNTISQVSNSMKSNGID